MINYTPVKREWHNDRWYVLVAEEAWRMVSTTAVECHCKKEAPEYNKDNKNSDDESL